MFHTISYKRFFFAIVMVLLLSIAKVNAQDDNSKKASEQKFLIEPRFTIVTADGEPANDITMFGLYGRYRLTGDWHVTLAFDYTEYDFEEPYKILGIKRDTSVSKKALDAPVSGVFVSAGMEREFTLSQRFKPYLAGGLGVGFLSADDITGPVQGGGQFNVTTDTGTEFIPHLNCGIRWFFWQNISLDIGAKVEHHFADWEVRDNTSGRSGSIDDYTTFGGYAGLAIQF